MLDVTARVFTAFGHGAALALLAVTVAEAPAE
ncbi:hypothetical protein X743_21425 [Mesorhizobium sp. LNHC252B00]|nr:hypothetical protein X743_21425 [Mesorhizobium sp. LNHC252B00]